MKPQETAGHPDANLLAAFAENALPQSERATVLAHLAGCADCRDSLALASSTPSIAASEPQRRFSPLWRWVAPAAAVAALCLFTIVYQRQFTRAPVRAPDSVPQLALKIEPPVLEPQMGQKEEVRKKEGTAARKTPRITFRAPTGSEPVTAAIPRPPRTPPPQVQADAVNSAKSIPVLPALPEAPPPQMQANSEVSSSASGFTSSRARSAFAAPLAKFKKSHAPSFLWSINAGSIQRSADEGKTWEPVPISDGTVFRTLAAEGGSEIWAGATNGTLFHSSDGGGRWQQVKVGDENAQLSGGIVTINARNLPRIEITTDSGEQWISEDSGVHWRRIR